LAEFRTRLREDALAAETLRLASILCVKDHGIGRGSMTY